MMQWRKWRDASSDVVGIQLEAAMETSLVKVSAFYINEKEDIKVENSKLNNVILLENTIVKNKEISNAIIGSYSNEIKEKDAYVNERNVY